MGGPLAPLAGQALRDRAPQRYGELQRELAFSGRPANPPPPSGESGEEGGRRRAGDASPAPAPQPTAYLNARATAVGIARASGDAADDRDGGSETAIVGEGAEW